MKDDIIDKIIEIVEENLTYEGFGLHCYNCEIYAFISDREKVRKYIKKLLGVKHERK